jgi:hypothetical protein
LLGIRALEHRGAARRLDQRVEDRLAPALGARREELRDEHVGVAVHHHAGQAVGLAVHEAQRIGVPRRGQGIAQRERAAHPSREERLVDRCARLEAPDARADLRGGAPRGERERRALGAFHLHRVARAGLAGHALHRTGEDPRVAALHRLLAPLLQDERAHFFFARGCAAS